MMNNLVVPEQTYTLIWQSWLAVAASNGRFTHRRWSRGDYMQLLYGNAAHICPIIEKVGIVTQAEMAVASLEGRLQQELLITQGVIRAPMLVGSWAQVA